MNRLRRSPSSRPKLTAQEATLAEQNATISAQQAQLAEQNATISAQQTQLAEQKAAISAQQAQLAELEATAAQNAAEWGKLHEVWERCLSDDKDVAQTALDELLKMIYQER